MWAYKQGTPAEALPPTCDCHPTASPGGWVFFGEVIHHWFLAMTDDFGEDHDLDDELDQVRDEIVQFGWRQSA